jgi:hypothetical protein
MEELNNKELEEAKLQNDAKNKLYKQLDEVFKNGFYIDENGILKIKEDETEKSTEHQNG